MSDKPTKQDQLLAGHLIQQFRFRAGDNERSLSPME
jgi:hypothetical protein